MAGVHSDGGQQQQQQHQQQQQQHQQQQSGEPLLTRELGVALVSMERLFRADGSQDYEQPVWMVVNLQGKIKGSYTAEKMMEFCRRGTLSARQLVLGIDKDLPYVFRQEMSFYRPLGTLAIEVHNGARYVPLSAARAKASPPSWEPTVRHDGAGAAGGDGGGGGGAGGAGHEPSSSGAQPAGGGGGGDGRGAVDAALRDALQRLFAPPGLVSGRQPMWLYINHLGWCRGPFSGGKLLHAHLCGRLPRDTLVVGYEPGVPVFMLSGEVTSWFRPLGSLLDNVKQGYSYSTVTWRDVTERNTPGGGGRPWSPVVWSGGGEPPPVIDAGKLLTQAPASAPAAAAAGAKGHAGSSGMWGAGAAGQDGRGLGRRVQRGGPVAPGAQPTSRHSRGSGGGGGGPAPGPQLHQWQQEPLQQQGPPLPSHPNLQPRQQFQPLLHQHQAPQAPQAASLPHDPQHLWQELHQLQQLQLGPAIQNHDLQQLLLQQQHCVIHDPAAPFAFVSGQGARGEPAAGAYAFHQHPSQHARLLSPSAPQLVPDWQPTGGHQQPVNQHPWAPAAAPGQQLLQEQEPGPPAAGSWPGMARMPAAGAAFPSAFPAEHGAAGYGHSPPMLGDAVAGLRGVSASPAVASPLAPLAGAWATGSSVPQAEPAFYAPASLGFVHSHMQLQATIPAASDASARQQH